MIVRGRRNIRPISLTTEHGEIPEPGSAEGHVLSADAFDRAFERLPAEQRALLMAHHLDGREVATIAADLAVPIGTVKSRLHTARSALARALERDE